MHQCVHCSKIYPNASKELIEGCSCGSHFFFYIRDEQFEKLKEERIKPILELKKEEKEQVEKEVREITGLEEEQPVILDLESVRILGPGKFEIDVVNLFNEKRPVVYKIGEGKYVIDLALSFKKSLEGEKS